MLRHPHSLLQPKPAEERRDLRDAQEARQDGEQDSAEARSAEAAAETTRGPIQLEIFFQSIQLQ